ncbi:Serine/threonine-protein kinase stk11 [Balamuthia mandrillaris]
MLATHIGGGSSSTAGSGLVSNSALHERRLSSEGEEAEGLAPRKPTTASTSNGKSESDSHSEEEASYPPSTSTSTDGEEDEQDQKEANHTEEKIKLQQVKEEEEEESAGAHTSTTSSSSSSQEALGDDEEELSDVDENKGLKGSNRRKRSPTARGEKTGEAGSAGNSSDKESCSNEGSSSNRRGNASRKKKKKRKKKKRATYQQQKDQLSNSQYSNGINIMGSGSGLDFTWRIKDTEIVYRTKSPKTVNQYILGEVLGKGSYGKVREALDTTTLHIVAIKILKKQLLRKLPGGGGEASVKQEIAIMKTLKHPNVVAFIESFSNEEKGKLYIVLEHVGGGTLQDLLNRVSPSRLSLKQARSFFLDLINGLEYIHGQGVVHRDIKPGNLMITEEGKLKISDFGVAEQLSAYDDPSYSSKTQGSPAFQPPEVASGAERITGVKGDVWAAGVSLYYIITGKYPFEGSTVYTLFENIAKADYNIPAWVDRPLADLLHGMLEPDKEKRFSIAKIKSHRWFLQEIREEEEEGGETAEILPSRTMFTPEFIAEVSKNNKEDDIRTNTSSKSLASTTKRACTCILF